MKTRNYHLITAGIINLFTALLHTIGGQLDLINPMLSSSLNISEKTQLLGVWHMVTVILFSSSLLLLYYAFNKKDRILIRVIGYLYILLSIPFIVISLLYGTLVPQWILLLPIGILSILGVKKVH